MARPQAPLTDAERFLAPLTRFGQTLAELDTLVIWQSDNWSSGPHQEIEAEETAYYAEGLIEEGFAMEWRLIALAGQKNADHAKLYVWQEGEAPPPETAEWDCLEALHWPPKG